MVDFNKLLNEMREKKMRKKADDTASVSAEVLVPKEPGQPSKTMAPASLPPLTFLEIETELLELLVAQEEVAEDLSAVLARNDGAGTEEATQLEEAFSAITLRIDQYMAAKARKVDGIATTHKAFSSAMSLCSEEKKRLAREEKLWESRMESLERSVMRVMLLNGDKEYRTPTHSIRLCGNGGEQPLETNLEVMAKQSRRFMRVMAVMPLDLADLLLACVEKDVEWADWKGLVRTVPSSIEPDNTRIKEELKKGGSVAGAELKPRGKHVRIS